MIKVIIILFAIFFLNSCHSVKKKKGVYKNEVNKESLDKSIYKILEKDSVLENDIVCKELHIFYYANGIIKEKGCQGTYNAMGTSVGTWFNYDSINGNLIKKVHFYLGKPEDAYKKVMEFYTNERIKSIKYFKNDMLYEIAADSIMEWQFFSKEGDLINTINYDN